MWPDRVSNPGPPTYESGALPIALRGPFKRSTRYVFYDFINRCTEIFCRKNQRSFCTAKASQFFRQNNISIHVLEI